MKNCLEESNSFLLKRSSTIIVEIITIATLIKLLAIRIVARSFFGLFNKFITLRLLMLLDSFKSLLFTAESEKKATSDPDIIADRKTSITIKKIVRPRLKVIGWKIDK